ncbi:MAG: uridine kinase [Paracoccaceae bacterium]|jgi:uridine kinase
MNRRVVAISGPPGSGKTRISRAVGKQLGAQVVEYDRYEQQTRRSAADIEDWLRRGAPYDEIAVPGMAAAIAQAPGLVILDTPLGGGQAAQIGPVDALVWIDCPADIALARKIAQLAGTVTPEQAAGFTQWLGGYLAAYEKIVRPACEIQVLRVRPGANLIVDATRPADAVQSAVAAFISKLYRD